MTFHAHAAQLVSFVSVRAILLAAVFLAGCSKSEEAPKPAQQPAPQAPAAQAPAPQPAAFRIERIDLGNAIGADKKVSAPTSTFKPNDTIYASILTDGASPNVSLGVRWTYEDGQLVDESSQSIAPTGPAATEFHIAKPDGWPAGKYKVEVSANGQSAGAREFTVSD
jgi:hypothetical protein